MRLKKTPMAPRVVSGRTDRYGRAKDKSLVPLAQKHNLRIVEGPSETERCHGSV